MKTHCIIAFLVLLPVTMLAQTTIETDRPDQTESPSTVPHNYLQVESGFMYEKVNREMQSIFHPTVLWRYGLYNNFEFRIQTDLTTEKSAADTASGLAPVAVGFKAKLVEGKKTLPDISFVGHLSISELASPGLQTRYWAPDFRFLFKHTISEKFDISYNLGAEWKGETPDATALYTLAANFSGGRRVSVFAEFYGYLNKYETADHRFDVGATCLITDNFLADLSVGKGLSQISPDIFVSAGLSYRFHIN